MKATVENKKTAVKKEVKQTACAKACNAKHSEHKKETVRTTEKEKGTSHKGTVKK